MSDTPTPNLNLAQIEPNRPNWSTAMNNNLSIIDAAVGTFTSINGVTGVWENSTTYPVDTIVVDSVLGRLYTCRELHISAGVPTTFAQDRAAHTTYWTVVEDAPIYRGTWATNTFYINNDFVLLSNVYYVCRTTHTSGTFATDLAAGKWEVLLDFSTAVSSAAAAAVSAAAALASQTAAAASASAASTSATSAATSATTATTQATSAATSATNAATSETNAATSATTASTQASISTAQAVISTAQAVIATTQAGIAKVYGMAAQGALSAMVSQCYAVLQQLQEALAAGVSSFNGRTGVVVTTTADFQGVDDQIILRSQVFG